MKIAIWHNLHSGGGYRAMYDQVCGLTSRGHHVEIWCPESAERDLLPIDRIALVHRHPFEVTGHTVTRHAGICSAWRRYNQTLGALLQLENHVMQCAAEIDSANFDVVLAHPSVYFYMHPLARFLTTPSVLYLQEPYRCIHEARPSLPWEALPDHPHPFRLLRYWRKFGANLIDVQTDRIVLREERRAALEWDRILCNSFFSRESMVRAHGIDVHTCYLGVDLSHFSPSAKTYSNYLIGLGGLNFAKGAHVAVEALARIPISIRPALRWIGNFADTSYLRYCEQLAQKNGVDFSCKVRVSESELVDNLQQALALVYPTVLEPFGYAPLEANACGTPVIGIAEGGVRETVVDGLNGLLVPNRCPDSWAHVIMRLIQEQGLRKQLSEQGITWANEQWAMHAAIMRLEKELSMVIDSGRRNIPPASVLIS